MKCLNLLYILRHYALRQRYYLFSLILQAIWTPVISCWAGLFTTGDTANSVHEVLQGINGMQEAKRVARYGQIVGGIMVRDSTGITLSKIKPPVYWGI
jgi:hypothetical protein